MVFFATGPERGGAGITHFRELGWWRLSHVCDSWRKALCAGIRIRAALALVLLLCSAQ